jgi:hypothetical protein
VSVDRPTVGAAVGVDLVVLERGRQGMRVESEQQEKERIAVRLRAPLTCAYIYVRNNMRLYEREEARVLSSLTDTQWKQEQHGTLKKNRKDWYSNTVTYILVMRK